MIWNHVKSEIFSFTSLGIFYVAFIGGLFFLFTPIDPVYIGGLLKGNFSPVYAFAMFSGLFLSYCINYIIGFRFSKASRNLISAKEFYKTKVLLNRFGNLAIIFMNMLGFGAQQLIFVLGVFRYNKLRTIVLSVIGILIRYTILTLVVLNIH